MLTVTGGHRVDLDAFAEMMAAVAGERGWRWAHAVHPGASAWLDGDAPKRWSAILLHDLCGLELRRGEPPTAIDPDPADIDRLGGMLAAGQGLVVLHHALASWPAWDAWADAVGGRFLYAPASLRGAAWPSSGTRIATYDVDVVAPDHPVCAGVGDLTLHDELYLCPVFTDEVVPLVRARVDMDPHLFTSTYEHVLVGEADAPDCDGHPPGTDLVVWATAAGPSPIVYVQPGDSAATFAVPGFRRLVGNAIEWVASADAHAWAATRA